MVPERTYPETVKDIVFMTGLNDCRDTRVAVETIINWQKDACQKYDRHFKDVRFHIVAVAPLTEKERELNWRLQEYALSAGISFISNDVLLDEITGVHFCYPASEKSEPVKTS